MMTPPYPQAQSPPARRRLDVLFRSCSRVYSFHGYGRVIDATKTEIITHCLNSLIRSIELARDLPDLDLTLTVIDDHSEQDCLRILRDLLVTSSVPAKLISMTGTTGNGASLRFNYEHAKVHCEDLIYFVEDDYLHDAAAVSQMVEMYRNLKQRLSTEPVLFPCDYPHMYREYYPSSMLLGKDRYWRNIGHTTGTIFLSRKILLDHWDRFMDFTRYGEPGVSEDTTINLIYRNVPCFSPMPTLAVHLADESCISPFVDWKYWWRHSIFRPTGDSCRGSTATS